MPNPLVTRRDIATGAVSFQKRRFGRPTGKAKEARVHFAFTTANVPVSMPHGLGKRPSAFTIVAKGLASGAGSPTIYNSPVFWATSSVVALSSNTALSWCEIKVYE